MNEQPQQPQQNLNISDNASLKDVQIGGIAGRDLNVTQIQGQVVYATVYDRIHAPNGLSGQPVNINPLTPDEYRQRKVLLNKVKKFWIEGVLEKSLHNQVIIELGLEEKQNAIQPSFPGVEEFPAQSKETRSIRANATEFFVQMGEGRTLLILGEPGSGKTITLLKIVQSLIERTEKNLRQQIPVVFNLSSWAIKQQTIKEWLIEQLHDRYGIDKSFAQAWIEKQQLILFLDGLDEVKVECRNNCIRELKKFTKLHGVTEMVVCCRIQDYEALEEKLKLQSAICIQALTQSQIEQYLEHTGEQLLALKNLLKQDTELREFATSPLILSVMSLAYQNSSKEQLSFLLAEGEWKQRLFEKYIERMFQRKGQTRLYSKKKTKRCLTWLAKTILQESQTVFSIDKMQPNLLQSKYQKMAYKAVTFFISIFTLLNFDLKIQPIEISQKNEIKYFQLIYGHLTVFKIIHYRTVAIFLVGGFYMFLQYNEVVSETVRDILIPIVTLILGGLEINLFYILTKKRKTLRNIHRRYYQRLLANISQTPIPSQYPNEKIFNSAKTMMKFLLMGVIVCPSMILFLFIILQHTTQSINFISDVFYALPFFVYFIIMMILINGGKACIQHFVIRLILYHNNDIPWNYARFLDYAADRLFMRKVGGGYIFVHRMLLEHFAQMELEQRPH